MPKRSCPFDSECFNPIKKQVANDRTITKVSQMKIIYDRTMQLLFEGANAKHCPHPSNHVREPESSRFRQTFLDIRCQLKSNGAAESRYSDQHDLTTDTMMRCGFCDKNLSGSSKKCSRCGETFCQMCSTESFNNFSDHFICLSCG